MLRLKILYGRYRHHLPDLYLDAEDKEFSVSPPIREEVARRIKQDFPDQFELIEEKAEKEVEPQEAVKDEAEPVELPQKPKRPARRSGRRAGKKK